MTEHDLIGIYEIAEMAGVRPSAVVNWRTRFSNFPPAVVQLKSGPVFERAKVKAWLRRRKISMNATTVISTINLKGGVGKSTTTVAIAEMLSAEFQKKVLVIDLDPQTNSTIMLIGEERWNELNAEESTLAQLFKDAVEPEHKKFKLKKALQKSVSNVAAVKTLDLLPSSLDLIDVQDRLATMPSGKFFAENPIDILRKATNTILDDYDYVLIDCPPNLGIITLNGLRISHGYIIPTIPDILSTYGIPQIVKRVKQFSDSVADGEIEPLGIVISKYREQSTLHRAMLKQMKKQADAPLFNSVIPESNQMAASAEFQSVSTMKQKYGYQGHFDQLRSLTEELMERVEA